MLATAAAGLLHSAISIYSALAVHHADITAASISVILIDRLVHHISRECTTAELAIHIHTSFCSQSIDPTRIGRACQRHHRHLRPRCHQRNRRLARRHIGLISFCHQSQDSLDTPPFPVIEQRAHLSVPIGASGIIQPLHTISPKPFKPPSPSLVGRRSRSNGSRPGIPSTISHQSPSSRMTIVLSSYLYHGSEQPNYVNVGQMSEPLQQYQTLITGDIANQSV